MKLITLLITLNVIYLFTSCGPFQAASTIDPQSVSATPPPGWPYTGGSGGSGGNMYEQNVAPVTVGCGYVNEPCVSVTVCSPNSNQCVTIDNVLVDTGSFGLRIFRSTVSALNLSPVNTGSGQLAECQSYLDNSSDWGPVAMATVGIGNEQTSQPVPIQLIDSTFQGIPSSCQNPDTDPTTAGFNGILGVGVFVDDCGPGCAQTAQNGTYYACNGANCGTGVAVPESGGSFYQVSNPVAFMPVDNNGIALSLPAVSQAGAASASGYLILGIGTQSNNTASGLKVFQTDTNGNFNTTFNGSSYSASFIDSGSNGLYFPQPSGLTTSSSNGFYNPSTIQTYNATQSSSNGTSNSVTFYITNADVAFSAGNPNIVFNDVGAPNAGGFDWGLPFFLGREIFVGIDQKSTNLGTGPLWAY